MSAEAVAGTPGGRMIGGEARACRRMAGGPDALLEELRAVTDGILALPDGLLELAMGDGPIDLARRMDCLDMRLPALRLLADAREVGKALTIAPGGGGAAAPRIVEAAESAPNSPSLYNLKAILYLTGQGLDDVASALRLVSVADAPVVVRAMDAIGRARGVYRRLHDLPAKTLVAYGALPEIADHLARLGEAGRALVARADEHRRALDQAYGLR